MALAVTATPPPTPPQTGTGTTYYMVVRLKGKVDGAETTRLIRWDAFRQALKVTGYDKEPKVGELFSAVLNNKIDGVGPEAWILVEHDQIAATDFLPGSIVHEDMLVVTKDD